MSRASVTTTPSPTATATATPPTVIPSGLAGPYATIPATQADPRVRAEVERLQAAALALRPLLRERQAQTEVDGRYATDVHEHFIEHGFYRMLLPLARGGLEIGIPGFLAVIAEIARGCPSTGWCLSLSTAHALTLSTFWPVEVQDDVFGRHGYMVAPASGQIEASTVVPTDGGYLLSGTWRYCSGAPYSTHFFPTVMVPATDSTPAHRAWMVIDRADYTVLEDWGRVIGMRGSGSNGITMSDVFVPAERLVAETWTSRLDEPAPGYALYGTPLYSGTFMGIAEGEVAAVSIGLGYAALDEYEDAIRTSRAPYDPARAPRADHDDWRRVLGLELARMDAATGTLLESGRLYEEYARRLTADGEPFDDARSMRLNNAYLVAEDMVWETVQHLMRTIGSAHSADGRPMQRYVRDMWTTISRTDELEFFAAATGGYHLAGQAYFEALHPIAPERSRTPERNT